MKGKTSMQDSPKKRVRRHLPRAARIGAVGAIVVARIAIGPLLAPDEPPTPATAAAAAALPADTAGQSATSGQPGKAGEARKAVQAPQSSPSRPSGQPQAQRVAAPSTSTLMPHLVWSGQQTFTPTAVQMQHAREIVQAGQRMKLPPRAYVIAVATSIQETKLYNYGNLGAANDHDSLGLFQQRPSSGWGRPAELTNPQYAATAFYKALKRVPGWQNMSLTWAAQAVQVSAFPTRYAQWELQAAHLVQAVYGAGPLAAVANGG
jgi:hypothetical protein